MNDNAVYWKKTHIGSGGPINRPITPNTPNSLIASSSPRVSTSSAINGRSMLLVARKIASINSRLSGCSSMCRI
ncbi:hypothetical protein PS838_06177 [Pseudomonas fluorescens]|nr:hypothetical protein PS838_06177 [Pseudomonas fluorescens]